MKVAKEGQLAVKNRKWKDVKTEEEWKEDMEGKRERRQHVFKTGQ